MDNSTSDSKMREFLLAEYKALKEELIKLIDIEQQVLSLAIIAAGTIFIAGVQTADMNAGALLLFGYPILATILAATWGYYNRRTWKLRQYIRHTIEQQFLPKNSGWENFDIAARLLPGRPLPGRRFFASRGVFLGTEVFAIIVGIQRAKLDVLDVLGAVFAGNVSGGITGIEWYFLIASIVCLPLTMLVMLQLPLKAAMAPPANDLKDAVSIPLIDQQAE